MQEPTYFTLAALLEGPLHGYAIIARARELSDGQVRLTAGTLYGALDRLSGEGLALVLPRLGAKLHARLWQPGVGEGLVTSSRCVALSAAVGLLLISVPAPVLGHASSGFPSRASASSATLPLGAGHARRRSPGPSPRPAPHR